MKAYLEPEEIVMLENVANNLRDRLLIRVLSRLGCRISEALGISVSDIDFNARTVSIKHLKIRLKLYCPDCGASLGRRHAYCPECGNKVAEAVAKELEHKRQRVLPVDKQTLDMLREYVDRGGPVVKQDKALIFGINRHRAWQIVKECAERAGLPKLTNPETGLVHNASPHKFRDAFAVNALKHDDSGEGLRMLQEHLGHTSFNTTAKYRKINGAEQRDWYDHLWDKHG